MPQSPIVSPDWTGWEPQPTPSFSFGHQPGAVYAAVVDDPVVAKVVSDEAEAELVCGLLRSAGIECGYRDTEALDSTLEEFTASGPREILVHQSDLEAARAVLVEAEG
jgi:hypothetical protein